jgi:hypothetical protein
MAKRNGEIMTEQKHKHKQSKPMTEEEKLALAALVQAKRDAETLRQEKLAQYDKRVIKMSFRQLRGELRRESRKPSDTSFLTAGIAAVMLTVLTNTQTKENPFAKLAAYPR